MSASQHPAAPTARHAGHSAPGAWPIALELPGVRALARHLDRTVSIFDLETTGLNWAGTSFGIVEVAVIQVPAEGAVEQVCSLINPENPCEWAARKTHGIRSAETRAAEPWGASWAGAHA